MAGAVGGLVSGARVAGSAALTVVTGGTPVRPEPALFEAMLDGWRSQQLARRLGESIIGARERTVRRFAEFTGGWPWSWTAGQLESWIATGGWAHSTVRSYQVGCPAFSGLRFSRRFTSIVHAIRC
jgi:integrase/recombinase XerC